MFDLILDIKEADSVRTVTESPVDKLGALIKLEEYKQKQHNVIHATLRNPRTGESIIILDHTAA